LASMERVSTTSFWFIYSWRQRSIRFWTCTARLVTQVSIICRWRCANFDYVWQNRNGWSHPNSEAR
jgi:hypothetical protein